MAPGLAPPRTIEVVEHFLNTADLETGDDDFAGPDELGAWLRRWDLLPPGANVTPHDVKRVRAFREALRNLAAANNGVAVTPEGTNILDDVGARAPLAVRLSVDGGVLEACGDGVDAALGKIVGHVYTAMAAGTWPRLKACARHSCRWVFYDRSKNASRTWCSMRVCGNRVKAQKYREHHSSQDPLRQATRGRRR